MRSAIANEHFYEIIFQVAYAHPVREQPLYYAGHPSGPISVASSGQNSFGSRQPAASQHQVGYPYYYGSQPTTQPQQFVDPSSRTGHAKVKRAPNSDCMLHDPAETLVVRTMNYYLDGHWLLDRG